MFQRKQRKFRRRSNGRNRPPHVNGGLQQRPRNNNFSNNHIRGNFRQHQSVEKLFEKYSTLAKEAMSAGDKILGENYLQHADHFMRIIDDKNKNKAENKIVNKSLEENKNLKEKKEQDN